MSAAGSNGGGALKTIMLRSSTPAPQEKVLMYLEGMRSSQASSIKSRSDIQEDKDDFDSTIQEQSDSVVGSNVEPVPVPGPNDTPGPRYQSYDTSTSFGNFGPLPSDGQTPYAWNTWQPPATASVSGTEAAGVPLPASAMSPGMTTARGVPLPDSIMSPGVTTARGVPLPESAMSPGMSTARGVPLPASAMSPGMSTARGVPLPNSVMSPGVTTARGVPLPDSVMSPGGTTTRGAPLPGSVMSPGATTARGVPLPESVMSPKSMASGKSVSRSGGGGGGGGKSRLENVEEERPMSPGRSQVSSRSRGTTAKPRPVPIEETPASPKMSTISRTYSLSPSDSATQPPKRRPRTAIPSTVPEETASVERAPSPKAAPSTAASGAGPNPMSGIGSSAPAPNPTGGVGSHQNRPFSPYRHAPTNEDLLHAALMNGMANLNMNGNGQPQSPRKAPSSRRSQASRTGSKVSTNPKVYDSDVTPTPSRPQSPPGDQLTVQEQRIVREALTPYTRSTVSASGVGMDVANSHFHDMDLCILLHQAQNKDAHDVVKRALRKAIKQRVKKLGMKYDTDSIETYRKSFHNHDPSVHLQSNYQLSLTQPPEEAPAWARELMEGMRNMQERLDDLSPKIDRLRPRDDRSYVGGESRYQATFQSSDIDLYAQTPQTQTVNIHTQPTGESGYVDNHDIGQSETQQEYVDQGYEDQDEEGLEEGQDYAQTQEGDYAQTQEGDYTQTQEGDTHVLGAGSEYVDGIRTESPGKQYLEEELYRLQMVRGDKSEAGVSHRTWEIARERQGDEEGMTYDDPEGHNAITESGIPEIPDAQSRRAPSPPLPALPEENTQQELIRTQQQLLQQQQQGGQIWAGTSFAAENGPPPWQRIHQRLLSWAIVWPFSDLEDALTSTTRGEQVDEVALSIWSTQTYKRYVRSKMTDSPQGRVDRLFVPPNMADAINNAVFHGRHGDASGMLRDLWSPFGLEGMPRLLIVLAKHRSDPNHWVVHRFSLPDGALTTYDSYPERTLPDGRPLGWWFAIRVAWPDAIYPSPDHLMQKMVRLHRPMQLGIDNSVAAAGIWRNLLMGSRAERSLDLERLRDLIHTEVKNLKLRKEQGKLSIGGPRPNWDEMN